MHPKHTKRKRARKNIQPSRQALEDVHNPSSCLYSYGVALYAIIAALYASSSFVAAAAARVRARIRGDRGDGGGADDDARTLERGCARVDARVAGLLARIRARGVVVVRPRGRVRWRGGAGRGGGVCGRRRGGWRLTARATSFCSIDNTTGHHAPME